MKKMTGFTLMELMTGLAIVAILLSIAIPSYQEYTTRNNRGAVQSEMLQIASFLERYKAQQLTYQGATLPALYGSLTYPKAGGSVLYNFTLTISANATSWELAAVPASGSQQTGDGALKLDSQGRRCWNKGSDIAASCNLANPQQAWSVR
ncbi:type IV pilin protein [Agitococcus lubricus]|uniref:Type IV pilus assembly protein PilE n=1 Tax=Agitococcus lubricus TaxID=1077255 RepID=A0A2T5J2B3_9GAMM|nr:type IV pilin protein [Agitococcus lubricus]PTQ90676.1 type IV pilus assembly protein PilE [Agitococcus lubricus]